MKSFNENNSNNIEIRKMSGRTYGVIIEKELAVVISYLTDPKDLSNEVLVALLEKLVSDVDEMKG